MLIILLKREKVSTFFATKAIRSFIQLTWSKYRSAIIKYVFIPNLVYLLTFIALASFDLDHMSTLSEITSINELAFPFLPLLITNFAISIYMYRVEAYKLEQEGIRYFHETSNNLNLVTNSLNFLVIGILLCKFFFGTHYFEMSSVKVLSSINCFCMWLKSLYWLRLFNSTAYFITLIEQTFSDIKVFLFLMLIIITAFANVYSFLDVDSDNHIVKDYTNNKTFNSFL